jgi:hypothetical protein
MVDLLKGLRLTLKPTLARSQTKTQSGARASTPSSIPIPLMYAVFGARGSTWIRNHDTPASPVNGAIACPEDCIAVLAMDRDYCCGQATQEGCRRAYLRHVALHVLRPLPGSVPNVMPELTQD